MIFNLKRKWFEMIARGEKTIEYREVKPYWTKRLAKLAYGAETKEKLIAAHNRVAKAVMDAKAKEAK